MHVHGIDVINGYQHAPPPATPTYVEIDEQYADWYANKFATPVDRSLVIPLGSNLQGHPEAGAIFSKCIAEVLKLVPLTTTTHEPCLYWGGYQWEHGVINATNRRLCHCGERHGYH